MVSEAMSSALITGKGKPEKLSFPALANQQFQNINEYQWQGMIPEFVNAVELETGFNLSCAEHVGEMNLEDSSKPISYVKNFQNLKTLHLRNTVNQNKRSDK